MYLLNMTDCATFERVETPILPKDSSMGLVILRPYIGILLNYLLNRGFKLSIFTAGSRDYAKGITSIICDAVWGGE